MTEAASSGVEDQCRTHFVQSSVMQGSTVVSNEEFRERMQPLADALAAFAVAMSNQPAGFGHLPGPESRAMAELAAEKQWSTPDWLEPSRNAHSYGFMLAYVLTEHLAALAATLGGSAVGPAFGHLPSVRAIMEVAPVAAWLLDPGIGIEQRIQRSIVYRLDSANQQGRLTDVPGAVEAKDNVRAAVMEYSRIHGWEVANGPTGAPVVAGETLPRPGDAFSRTAFGNDGGDLGQVMWNVLSASSHGTWYALSSGLQARMQTDPLDPNGGLAPIVVESRSLTMYGLVSYYACETVQLARDRLMGWPASAALTEASIRLGQITRNFASELKQTDFNS